MKCWIFCFTTDCFWIILWLAKFFETFVILSAVLLPIKSLVASAVFWSSFKWIYSKLFSIIKTFLTLSVFTYIFSNLFAHVFNKIKNSKFHSLLQIFISWLNWITSYFLYVTLWLLTKVMFISSSISSGLKHWIVHHT